MENRFEIFIGYISSIYKNAQKIKNKVMYEFELKSIHVMCLYCLYHYGNVTHRLLVNFTNEDKGAITRALYLLEEKGFIENGRKHNAVILLTDAGKEVAKHIDVVSEDIVSMAADGYTDDDRELFYSMLDTISKNLDGYVLDMEKKK